MRWSSIPGLSADPTHTLLLLPQPTPAALTSHEPRRSRYGYLDDAAYIASLIAEIQRDYRVAEIFTFGWCDAELE